MTTSELNSFNPLTAHKPIGVKSSHVKVVHYDETNKILKIEFANGSNYLYHEFPQAEYKKILNNLDKIGSHFSANIRNKYKTIKI